MAITENMIGSEVFTEVNRGINQSDAMYACRRWVGAKMVVFGDSTWNQNTIQPELIRLLGVTYNATEMSTGTGGYKPTAYPGSTIVGYNDLPDVGDNSLYRRADDVYRYSPDLILMVGGANDNATSQSWHYTYNHEDEPYTGATFTGTGYTGTPSYVSCLKGIFKKLTTNSPAARIIFMGRFEFETTKYSSANYTKLINRALADQRCCQEYGVGYVNAQNLFCATNITTYMSSTAHPNTFGGELMALEFAKVATLL